MKMVLKTYLVYDLIAAVPNHRFDSHRLPTTENAGASGSPFVDDGAGGLLGGLGGGMG